MSRVVSELLELQTHDTSRVVCIERVEKSHGGDYQCVLSVVSGWISISRPFYFDDVALSVAVPALRKMASGEPGECVIKGQWEEDFVQLSSNMMGHVLVSGEFVEPSEFDQRVCFSFRTDQTVLVPLANGLQRLMEA